MTPEGSDVDRELEKAHRLLESATAQLGAKIGPVLYSVQDRIPRFELVQRGPRNLEVLMAVRVCSGLNACMALLREGYVQEIGVILRTVTDFLLTIDLVEDALESSQPTEAFSRFVEGYFSQEIRTEHELRRGSAKLWYLPAKKKRAAEARLLAAHGNPDEVRRLAEAEEEVLSGYVHGCYRQVMELYQGSVQGSSEGFLLAGALGTPHMGSFRRQIALYTHRALNTIAAVAYGFSLVETANALIEERKRFEAGPAYP